MTEVEIGLAIQDAVAALENLAKLVSRTKKEIIQQLAEKFEKAGWPVDMISEKIIDELHDKRNLVAKSHINDCLDEKYKKKKTENVIETPEKDIEESSKPIVIDTSGEQIEVDDETDEQHDTRSENIIQDAVKASMNASSTAAAAAAGHDYDQEKGNDHGLKYDYSNAQKEENKIRFELKQDVEKLRLELDNATGIIELQRGEIEASKNQKLEARIIDIEESNKTLKIENEQLRHALTKHSFETAKEMEEKQVRGDPRELENLTNYIKQLEDINTERYNQIQELNKKIESFSHLDHVVEHQPLELDLSESAGFLGQFFQLRGRKIKLIHDGIKIAEVSK